MSRYIDGMLNELLEVNFKTYGEYIEAARCLNALRLSLYLNEILKIIKLDGFNSEHFKANCTFHRRYYMQSLSPPGTKLDAIKLLDNHDLLYLLDHEDQYEETKINLDNYKTLKNLGDLI